MCEEKGTPLTEVLFYFALPYGATDEEGGPRYDTRPEKEGVG